MKYWDNNETSAYNIEKICSINNGLLQCQNSGTEQRRGAQKIKQEGGTEQ